MDRNDGASGWDSGAQAAPVAPLSPFARFDHADAADLIGEYPLAWVTPRCGDARLPSLLPLLVETDARGAPVALIGHMARHNPLYPALDEDGRALVLFTGPQAYVSPALVSDPGWAPTWNYAQLRIEVQITFAPEQGGAAIQQLIDVMEVASPSGWTKAAMGERYAPMEQAIIAFRAEILRLDGRFKLGQDEKPERLREILAGHPDPALCRWMRRFNAARL